MKNKERYVTIQKALVHSTFTRFILYCFLVTIGYFITFLVIYFILTSLYWYETSAIYQILAWGYDNIVLISVLLLFTGYAIVLYRLLGKNYEYFLSIIDAVEAINDGTSDVIEIPYTQLSDVSTRLNQIKVNVRRNARAAKEAEQRKNDLLVYLAHDLKTPLTSVIGYLTLLRDEKHISPELQNRYIHISLNKAERLEELINEFFEITRFNLTQQVIEPSTVHLTRLLEQLTYECKPMLLEKKLTCTLVCPKDLYITCDIQKMQRALDNLLCNAVNYAFLDSDIQMVVEDHTNHIEMTFTNQGNTIPKEKLDRIFEQFYRIDSARKTSTGGAGLGLAITKEIITLHGGTILANSVAETISFVVTLPKI